MGQVIYQELLTSSDIDQNFVLVTFDRRAR